METETGHRQHRQGEGAKLRVLYLAGKRGREASALRRMEVAGEITLRITPFHLRKLLGPKGLRAVAGFLRAIRDFRPDVILTEDAGAFSFPLVFIRLFRGIPYVVRIKGDHWMKFDEIRLPLPLRERVVKLLNYSTGLMVMRHSLAVLAISEYLAQIVRDRLGNPPQLLIADIPILPPPGVVPALPEDLGDLADRSFLLTVTNFNFWKKLRPLAPAVENLAPVLRKLGLRWLIVGDGFFLERFRAKLPPETEDVIWLAGRRTPAAFYPRARALLHLSGTDGLPNVILESWQSGLPVIIEPNSPVAEFIEDGVTGCVLDCGDAARAEALFRRLGEDSAFCRNLANAGRRLTKERYSDECVGHGLVTALRRALQTAGPRTHEAPPGR